MEDGVQTINCVIEQGLSGVGSSVGNLAMKSNHRKQIYYNDEKHNFKNYMQ